MAAALLAGGAVAASRDVPAAGGPADGSAASGPTKAPPPGGFHYTSGDPFAGACVPLHGSDTVTRVATGPSDEQLMRRYQAGDVGAFEALLRRHRAALHAFLCRLTGDPARAEDLSQETWLKIVAAAPRWERRARFTTWALSIARNLAVDEARRAVHRAADSLDAARPGSPPIADCVAGGAPGPDRGAESALLRPKLEAALAALPLEQREVFVLREYAGVPFADIAEITGAPVPTVKSRMRYALEALRAELARVGVLPEDAREPRSALP